MLKLLSIDVQEIHVTIINTSSFPFVKRLVCDFSFFHRIFGRGARDDERAPRRVPWAHAHGYLYCCTPSKIYRSGPSPSRHERRLRARSIAVLASSGE